MFNVRVIFQANNINIKVRCNSKIYRTLIFLRITYVNVQRYLVPCLVLREYNLVTRLRIIELQRFYLSFLLQLYLVIQSFQKLLINVTRRRWILLLVITFLLRHIVLQHLSVVNTNWVKYPQTAMSYYTLEKQIKFSLLSNRIRTFT